MRYNRVMFAPDEPAAGGAPGATDQGGAVPGWVSALPDEFKVNDYVKGFQKPGDFVKEALDHKTQRETLETRLQSAIFKPGEGAKPEDIAAYRKALGVPDSPTDYKFTPAEGVEHDPKMLEWAASTFHKHGVSQEAAAGIAQEWDGFVQGLGAAMEEAHTTEVAEGVKVAEETLRGEWKQDFDKNVEETKRGYQAFEKIVPGFGQLIDSVEVQAGLKLGNDPRMLKVFHAIGRAIGDDGNLPGMRPQGGAVNPGAGGLETIYKTPNPPSN